MCFLSRAVLDDFVTVATNVGACSYKSLTRDVCVEKMTNKCDANML